MLLVMSHCFVIKGGGNDGICKNKQSLKESFEQHYASRPLFFVAYVKRVLLLAVVMFFSFSSCCLGKCLIHTPAIQIFWDFFFSGNNI